MLKLVTDVTDEKRDNVAPDGTIVIHRITNVFLDAIEAEHPGSKQRILERLAEQRRRSP